MFEHAHNTHIIIRFNTYENMGVEPKFFKNPLKKDKVLLSGRVNLI